MSGKQGERTGGDARTRSALWLSQLIVFAVHPLFVAKRGKPMSTAW